MAAPGISPSVLHAQIANTAAWALDDASIPAAAIARDHAAIHATWFTNPRDPAYFRLLLAAHYLTVGTFVPTDVDARIRHHAWVEAEAMELAALLDAIDEAATWDARKVSARTLDDPNDAHAPSISGHDGEWLSVWSGALGRALLLEHAPSIERCATAIDASLARQARIYSTLEKMPNRAFDTLRAATILAHNAGDLSRVVELWAKRPHIEPHRTRLMKLGHDRGERHGGAFLRAGALNKAMTAIENHRFLALRAPRALRLSRAFLLPIGPFFDAWGVTISRSKQLSDEDRAEVVEALVETHLRDATQLGCLRALAAIHENAAGGLDRLAPQLPARMRKLVAGGPIREATRVSTTAFEARTLSRFKAVVATLPR